MDPRTQLPLHIAMLVSIAEAEGAETWYLGGGTVVYVRGVSEALKRSMLSSGFDKAADSLVWQTQAVKHYMETMERRLKQEWEWYSKMHDVPLRKQ